MTVTGLLEVFYLTTSVVFIGRKRGGKERGREGQVGREGGREERKHVMNFQLGFSSLGESVRNSPPRKVTRRPT